MKYVALAWFCLALALPAHAQCINGVCRQRVVSTQKVVQPLVLKQQQFLPHVSYQIGTHLQANAVGTHALRQSDEYQELQRLRGFREAVEMLAQQQLGASQVQAGEQEELPPLAAFPTIMASCSKCHSGDNPKGSVWLDGTVDLRSPEQGGLRDRIMQQVYNGHMPPNKPVDDATLGLVIAELYAEPTEDPE